MFTPQGLSLIVLYSAAPCKNVTCDFNAKCRALPNDTALCECVDDCTTEPVKPVCGSDMVTYPSECDLKAKACKEQKRTTVKAKGICRKYRVVKCDVTNLRNYKI